MMETWKKWMNGKNLRKWFCKENLVLMILVGVLLVIIALPVKKEEAPGASQTGMGSFLGTQEEKEGSDGPKSANGEGLYTSDLEYAAKLERRLTEVLSGMEGVGEAEVMITLRSSTELVVEKEAPVSRSETAEADAQGGSRTIRTSQYGENVVYASSGSSSTPYVVKTNAPQIEGVLVVAEGAGQGTVNRTVTEIVQALFGVEAHKIKVVEMETKTK